MKYAALVERLVARRMLRTPAIVRAFRTVGREHYLPAEMAGSAGEDHPLPIGHGQTNSQPYTVAFMLELLQPQADQRVLDVGCGSGWTTALLANIVGAGGEVIGTERIDDLAWRAFVRMQKNGIENAHVLHTPEVLGCPDQAPFDRILVSAAAQVLPPQLVEQLATDGIMVIPVRQSIFKVIKTPQGLRSEEYPGFSFVPLIE
jgi:protein-L-isoaspartate(D-aspartate) O-methyltransferase